MAEQRMFHLGDILSITTELLVSPSRMDGVHDILNYMTGDNLFTHQLPRAGGQCAPILLDQLPQLKAVETPPQDALDQGPDWVDGWLAEQVARYGEMLPVTPIAAAQRVIRDPIEELAAMVGTDRINAVEIPASD